MRTRTAIGIAAAVIFLAVSIRAQQGGAPPKLPPGAERPERNGGGTFGTVSTVAMERFEIKQANGEALTVLVSEQTEFRQGRDKIGLEDLKPGDTVMLRGQMNSDKQFVASGVRRMTPEEVERFRQMGDRAFGEIISLEGNQLKIHNPRQGDKTITVNNQTVFMKEGQQIALKDLKVGDRIFATGKEENGQFTATRVMTGQFRDARQGGRSRPEQP